MSDEIFKIEFYVPSSHLEEVKEALFDAGAGRVGNYDKCAWQTEGSGQFRPGAGSSPYLGSANKVESVREFKVELVCEKSCLKGAVKVLKQAHPYEEPAYSIIRLNSIQ